jgi:crotonobetainyl-CoA:carnitine CoA-transferase CaiB-like acyl-CoA transferase
VYRLPLAPYRVLDVGPNAAAAYAARLLGDAGAEVIAVEREARARTPAFLQLNRDKLGCALDFATPAGAALLRRLITLCDVVVEGFDAAERERLGLDYDALHTIRPDLIVASVGGSTPETATVGDIVAGTAAAGAICVALLHHRDTGAGQHVQLDAASVATGFGKSAALPSRQQALADARLRERRFFESVSHAREGVVAMPALPWRLGLTPCHVRLPAPQPGEHNRYVFAGLLGLSDAEIADLEEKDVIPAPTG